jgi:hypothetical protein
MEDHSERPGDGDDEHSAKVAALKLQWGRDI